jgi:alkylation response protein AidB-like acyl-CoA dehydrogenase
LGIQQKQDALHRLLEVWATGEAAASLGFAATRLFDELDPLEREKDEILASKGVARGMATFKAMRQYQKPAIEAIRRGDALDTLDPLVRYTILDAIGNVVCPAVKLWNTGHGANVMREAVSLMGGYGITEDCPGFLGHKWMDSQLEATYEGPEAVQRRQLSMTMTSEVFLAQFKRWIGDMRRLSSDRPGTGACSLATAMHLWMWTLNRLQEMTDANGAKLYHSNRQGVTFPMADALSWLLASRQHILDVVELEQRGGENSTVAEGLAGTVQFLRDLCHMHTARAAGEVGRICAELIYGYQWHPSWNAEDCGNCYTTDELMALEATMPGLASTAFDVIRPDGSHPLKAGPCARFEGIDDFGRIRAKLDGCLAGSQLAKDRAAEALTKVMIPAALDYPV